MNSIEKALQKQSQKASEQKKQEELQEELQKPLEPEQITQQDSVEKALKKQTMLSKGNNITSTIQIDFAMLEKKGFVSINSQRQLINEEYRAIKRKLLDNAFGPLSKSLNNSNIIMVTSSRPGEGKTFTAINLALSIALEKDKTVLLVDADVLRPNVMKTLELESKQGLMEYLLGENKDISEVMYKTNLDNLRIIPAGQSHHLSTELLASEKMFHAVKEFANRYPDRVVIVDTPPLLGINETAILANLAGQALVVTEESKTRLVDVEQAVKQLNPEMAIGFLVNKSARVDSKDSGQGYGYGYYYGGAN
ncbi:XrtA-associated tyrosine autokinase [Paraglaciecola sp. MB-3u-78]|jgi:protein-tyrosine kinase|uniref:XrtA-associated tyrosine autokinase n=1 Tax=Paraglaciecola sp. MB-3u-78 TaxID=2058332 RepID=UPI000C33E964|nr:XrtA-associated tyrosine autokinase [Paraglaciecola sp. MB-3u-78]PKG93029.1 exopolysaccharide biosynthesis protein [Paraglaciecola sp. MB-3u-78]